MRFLNFVKRHYKIFVVNFIVLGFIAFTLLAQFGVHVRVDKGVNLIPVEIDSSQSTKYIRMHSKSIFVTERYVYLRYENEAQKPFWAPVSVVFGRAGEDEIKARIQEGDVIKRNVFINTKTNEAIGVTRNGTSILALYYHNSKMFRYGILILIIVDIFIGLLIQVRKTKSKGK